MFLRKCAEERLAYFSSPTQNSLYLSPPTLFSLTVRFGRHSRSVFFPTVFYLVRYDRTLLIVSDGNSHHYHTHFHSLFTIVSVYSEDSCHYTWL
jgi:hypothetical protein